MDEQWKAIPGFTGYDVSDQGQVQSYYRKAKKGWELAGEPQRVLKPSRGRNRTGYRAVNLRRQGKTHHVRVAQLVLLAYVGPCPDGLEVCHNDGDPANDGLENLRYDTHLANCGDRADEGKVRAVCREYADGEPVAEIARRHGIRRDTIWQWAAGKVYPLIKRPLPRRKPGKPGKRKLSDQQVRDIVVRYRAGGVLMRELAEEHGVSLSTVSLIVNGKRWKERV